MTIIMRPVDALYFLGHSYSFSLLPLIFKEIIIIGEEIKKD